MGGRNKIDETSDECRLSAGESGSQPGKEHRGYLGHGFLTCHCKKTAAEFDWPHLTEVQVEDREAAFTEIHDEALKRYDA